MPSFRSIFTFATAALAGFAAAAPAVNTLKINVAMRDEPGLGAFINIRGEPVSAATISIRDEPVVAASVATRNEPVFAATVSFRRCDGGCTSVPDVFVGLKVDIDALADKCRAIQPINGAANVDAYVEILAQVKATIDVAVAAVKAFVGVKADVLLLQNGKLITINVCAQVIIDAILSICALLKIVLTVCVNVDVVVKLVAQISVSLVGLLNGVFVSLGPLLKLAVVALIKVHALLLVSVKLNAIVNL